MTNHVQKDAYEYFVDYGPVARGCAMQAALDKQKRGIMTDQHPMGCLYCGALWWPKDHPVHECVGSLKAKLAEAEKHQAPDPHAVPPHVLDTFIVSAGKELGYGTFLLQPENRISSLKAIMGHLIALVRQQNETKAEHDASLMRIKQLEERLQVDPGGSDMIDELEQALKCCRVERDAALQGVAFAESVIGPLKAELAEAKRQNQTFRVAFGAADDAAEHCQKMLLVTERERDEAVSLLAKAVALLRAVALGTSYTYMASDKSDRTTVSAVIEDAYAFLNRGKT